MQKLPILVSVLCLAIVGEAAWVYSRDGTNATLSARATLPVQGVSLSTGEVVVGLPNLGPAAWVDCGYWPTRLTPKPVPVSNEVYQVGGWILDRAVPEATPIWTPRVPPVRPKGDYSKRKVYLALKQLGAWDAAKAWMQSSGCWEDWEYATTLEERDPLIQAAVPALSSALGLPEARIWEILDQCRASR